VNATILSRAAKILGKEKDYEKYSALSDKIKKAINAKFLNERTGIYGSGLQTELSFPLFWGVTPENQKGKVMGNLVNKIHLDNDHIDIGLLGSKSLLNALSENGFADLAYTLASQEDYPGWAYWIVNGATTLSEGWAIDPKSKSISLNHIMFGEIGAWAYKALGGIHSDPANPGFKNIILKPNWLGLFLEKPVRLDKFNLHHSLEHLFILWRSASPGVVLR
jgi:alpha-L-rhamnosidase